VPLSARYDDSIELQRLEGDAALFQGRKNGWSFLGLFPPGKSVFPAGRLTAQSRKKNNLVMTISR
jgi:hypothetical protein